MLNEKSQNKLESIKELIVYIYTRIQPLLSVDYFARVYY